MLRIYVKMYSAVMQQEKGNLSKSTPSECKNQRLWGETASRRRGGGNINSQYFGQYRTTYPSYIAGRNVMPNWRKSFTIVTTIVRIDIYLH